MHAFIRKYAGLVTGSLSGFDRLVLRGTLRAISHVDGMRAFLASSGILLKRFGQFACDATALVKEMARTVASECGRPFRYLDNPSIRKDLLARQIAEQDRIDEGLICVLTAVEPCWSFDIFRNRGKKRLELVRRRRKGLFLYHYLVHPVFGFIHVRIQTWLPFDVQVWINGREWLCRQMDRRGMRYCRRGNTFTWIECPERAQRLASSQLRINWPKRLGALVRDLRVVHDVIFDGHPPAYYWSVYQSEWATDLMFRDPQALADIYPRLLRHGITHFQSPDVMRFLGKRVTAAGDVPRSLRAELISDLRQRPEGVRIKHKLGWNSVKLYDKEGRVLRVETTINRPQDFKVWRPREGEPNDKPDWRPMRQGVADLQRRAKVSQAANNRYLDALAAIDIKASLGDVIKRLAVPVVLNGRRYRALNPASPHDLELLAAVNRGEFAINGFRNRDLRALLYSTPATDKQEERRRSARTSRLLRLLRAHGLVTKVHKTNRYLLTVAGRNIIAAVLAARDTSVEALIARAA
jgi:hypothetical protein